MAQVLSQHPDVHVTFTLTPSLIEQLEEYANGQLVDRLMQLAEQRYFSPADKQYLLDMCFSINWDNIIRRYPPYESILNRRHLAQMNPDYFSNQTYRDLLVWFNLAWTDPNLLETDPFLAGLIQKGQNFTLEEATSLIQTHLTLIGQVLPTYKRLSENGQLELITVPFFHPILPLLVDSAIARRPSPGLSLPEPPFRAPEDAREQLRRAVAKHTKVIGKSPTGLWPSEGAVAPEILPLAAEAGIHWLATDEAILGESLNVYFDRDENGMVKRGDLLYHPWRVTSEKGDLAIIFRDHELSDCVGFTYQHLPGSQAAEDMIVRLQRIAQSQNGRSDALVSVILDGENAWESYEHNGDVFLHELYRRLAEATDLKPVTPDEHLAQHPPGDTLEHLASGSWIMGDFTTWIGDPEHIEAWSRLRDLREAYELWRKDTHPNKQTLQDVQSHLFAAEGSDWFWWYSHRNSSDQDALFDQLFRDYLTAAYQTMAIIPPDNVTKPIIGMPQQPAAPRHFITPRLVAASDPRLYWSNAEVIRPQASVGTMQQAGGVIQAVRYGNDRDNLYLRIELAAPLNQFALTLHLSTLGGDFLVKLGRTQTTAFLFRLSNGSQINIGPVTSALAEKIAEFAIPLRQIHVKLDQETVGALVVTLHSVNNQTENLPITGEAEISFAHDGQAMSGA